MQNLRLKPIVTEGTCVGCGLCAESCPSDAIRIDDVAKVNYDKCTACGNCARICPQSAIKLVSIQSTEVGSMEKRLKSLRKRVESMGKQLGKIEHELRELVKASPS